MPRIVCVMPCVFRGLYRPRSLISKRQQENIFFLSSISGVEVAFVATPEVFRLFHHIVYASNLLNMENHKLLLLCSKDCKFLA